MGMLIVPGAKTTGRLLIHPTNPGSTSDTQAGTRVRQDMHRRSKRRKTSKQSRKRNRKR